MERVSDKSERADGITSDDFDKEEDDINRQEGDDAGLFAKAHIEESRMTSDGRVVEEKKDGIWGGIDARKTKTRTECMMHGNDLELMIRVVVVEKVKVSISSSLARFVLCLPLTPSKSAAN